MSRTSLRLPLGVVLSVLATSPVLDRAACGQVVTWGVNGHHYEFVSRPNGISWVDSSNETSVAFYNGIRGHLVTVTSEAENDFIRSSFALERAWIGLTDQDPEGIHQWEGDFHWVTREPLSFTYWNEGEPNNRSSNGLGSGGHWVRYQSGPDQLVKWNDESEAADGWGYIIEYETDPPLPPLPPANAYAVMIDGPLGRRVRTVAGIQSMTQGQVAEQAAMLALAADGWNLATCGASAVPIGSGISNEWLAFGSSATCSENFGYPLTGDAVPDGRRHLMFHTDTTVFGARHDFGEPSPFGVISGIMNGSSYILGQREWGTYSVIPTSLILPHVTAVQLGGLTWIGQPYSVPLGSVEQLEPLPWTRVNQLSVVLSESVTIGFGDMVLLDGAGQPIPTFGPLMAAGPEPGTVKATWLTEEPLPMGQYELRLPDSIQTADGRPLDGEWADGQSAQSGNGTPGGDFAFRFNVLPGDVNGDYVVNVHDFAELRDRRGATAGSPNYTIFHDIDRRGSVDNIDFMTVPRNLFATLPQPSPAPSAAVPEPHTATLAALAVLFVAAAHRRQRRANASP